MAHRVGWPGGLHGVYWILAPVKRWARFHLRLSPMKPQEMMDLGDRYIAAIQMPGGGIRHDRSTAALRLCANGLVAHDLDFEGLCTAAIVAGKMSCLPAYADRDQIEIWSWCAQMLITWPPMCLTAGVENDLYLTELTVRAALGHERSLRYLAFPLLEMALRRASRNFVNDGRLIAALTLRDSNGVMERNASGSTKRVLLHQMLWLFDDYVLPANLRVQLDYFRAHIAAHLPGDPYLQISDWRNGFMHGEHSYTAIEWGIFSFALFVLLIAYQDQFDDRRAEMLKDLQFAMANPYRRNPRDFYPPA
jgi:hypothetical protein